jgi:hypothetical protein
MLNMTCPVYSLTQCQGQAGDESRGREHNAEVRVGGQARVQRVTLSLFAGSCAA